MCQTTLSVVLSSLRGSIIFDQIHAQLTVSNIKPYQVILRDSTTLTVTFVDSGTCRNGTIKIQLLLQNQNNNSTIGSFSWKELSDPVISGARWKATIAGLPVGGEYKAQFRALNNSETVTDSSSVIQNLLVGDAWLCAGQSNLMGEPGATLDAIMCIRAFTGTLRRERAKQPHGESVFPRGHLLLLPTIFIH